MVDLLNGTSDLSLWTIRLEPACLAWSLRAGSSAEGRLPAGFPRPVVPLARLRWCESCFGCFSLIDLSQKREWCSGCFGHSEHASKVLRIRRIIWRFMVSHGITTFCTRSTEYNTSDGMRRLTDGLLDTILEVPQNQSWHTDSSRAQSGRQRLALRP